MSEITSGNVFFNGHFGGVALPFDLVFQKIYVELLLPNTETIMAEPKGWERNLVVYMMSRDAMWELVLQHHPELRDSIGNERSDITSGLTRNLTLTLRSLGIFT